MGVLFDHPDGGSPLPSRERGFQLRAGLCMGVLFDHPDGGFPLPSRERDRERGEVN